jgi:hypothetical protein
MRFDAAFLVLDNNFAQPVVMFGPAEACAHVMIGSRGQATHHVTTCTRLEIRPRAKLHEQGYSTEYED